VALARISRSHRILIGSAVVAGALVLAPLSAGAAPHLSTPVSPGAAATATSGGTAPAATAADVTTKIASLATANEKLTEQLNAAQVRLDSAQAAADRVSRSAQDAQRAAAAAQRALAISLAQQYKFGTFSRTAALFSSVSGQSYLDQIQTLNLMAAHQADVAFNANAANGRAKAAQLAARTAVDAAASHKAAVVAQRADLQRQIGKYQSLLTTLTASARTAYFGSQNATSEQISAAVATYTIGSSPKDIIAVRAALTQLGKPYVWAAAGPDAFDCSGITMWAWAQAGVSMPHLASSQQTMGTPVDKSQLRPGDLVFFGSPAYHVAMYIGAGMAIQAPTSGDVVKISPLAAMSDYSSATRVG
jgi:cell wall-associated NlpC family hydrolase